MWNRSLTPLRGGSGTLSRARRAASSLAWARLGELMVGACGDYEGHACSVCVAIKAGSRHEQLEGDRGAAHYMQHVAHQRLSRGLAQRGCRVECLLSRDLAVHVADFPRHEMRHVLGALRDGLGGEVTDEHVAAARTAVAMDTQGAGDDVWVSDGLHAAAFGETGLGRPLLCPSDHALTVAAADVDGFRRRRHVAGHMAVTVSGVSMADFVKELRDSGFFSSFTSVPGVVHSAPITASAPRHTGDLTHVGVAFRGPGVADKEYVAACVLETLLGGGGSFSSGGPGKGLLSRLYVNVLCRHPSAAIARALADHHSDAGLVGVYGAAPPASAAALAGALLAELGAATSEAELARAKAQVTSSMHMGLESRATRAEDLARQLLFRGRAEPAETTAALVAGVTTGDLRRLVAAMLRTPPAVHVRGDGAPDVARQIADWARQHRLY